MLGLTSVTPNQNVLGIARDQDAHRFRRAGLAYSVRTARRGARVRGRRGSVSATATATATAAATATVERGQRATGQCPAVGARSRSWEGGRCGEAGSCRVIVISGGRI